MSRAPPHETPVSALNQALSPFGVIDFVDNTLSQPIGAAAGVLPGVQHGGVVGGPPAYLDAHGIRYVPAGPLESAAEEPAPGVVPMARRAAVEPTQVSKNELKARAQRQIDKFLSSEFDDDEGVRYRPRRSMSVRDDDDRGYQRKLRDLEEQISELEARRDLSRSRVEAKYDDQDGRLDNLRESMKAAAGSGASGKERLAAKSEATLRKERLAAKMGIVDY